MLVIPLQPIPSQIVSASLNNQACQIAVYQKSTGLYCNLSVNNTQIIGGVICQNANVIVRDAYLGFVGDIAFFDMQGSDDPVSTGLGTRWILVYLAPAELPMGVS